MILCCSIFNDWLLCRDKISLVVLPEKWTVTTKHKKETGNLYLENFIHILWWVIPNIQLRWRRYLFEINCQLSSIDCQPSGLKSEHKGERYGIYLFFFFKLVSCTIHSDCEDNFPFNVFVFFSTSFRLLLATSTSDINECIIKNRDWKNAILCSQLAPRIKVRVKSKQMRYFRIFECHLISFYCDTKHLLAKRQFFLNKKQVSRI